MYCPHCGKPNPEDADFCTSCGKSVHFLAGFSAPQQPVTDTPALIPYRNTCALIGYYLAVFSLIPCVGVPLAIAAVILGWIGFVKSRSNPAVKGKAHSITAIVLGSLVLLGHIGFILWMAPPR